VAPDQLPDVPPQEIAGVVAALRREMLEAASQLEFERAAALRDRLRELTTSELLLKDPASSARPPDPAPLERRRRRARPERRR
jgi:hypothetical protein